MNRNRSFSFGPTVCTISFVAATLLVIGIGRPVAADTLRITFTTTRPPGGNLQYDPRNVHAVWIEDNGGTFIETIGRWADRRRAELAQWNAADGTNIDGMTGATQSNYGTYTILWDMRDRNGLEIPDGVYRIRHELTNHNAGVNQFNRTTFTVDKNGVSSTQNIASQGGYQNVTIEYTAVTAVPPEVDNAPASRLTGAGARLNGQVVATGGEDPTVSIYWGNNDGGTDPAAWDNTIDLGTQPAGAFFSDIAGLTIGTMYYFRCYAENSAGGDWAGATESFVAAVLMQQAFQEGDGWNYFKGTTTPGAGWNDRGFDDSAWLSGPTGIGYGDGDDATVLNDMQNGYLIVYMRKAFDITDPANVISMTFTVDYDDGFVAYINNDEVERQNVDPATQAVANHEAGTPEVYDLTPYISSLVAGQNIFAIEVHNQAIDSSDLSMIPELTIEYGAVANYPDINLDPTSLIYSQIDPGNQSDLTFTVENLGDADLVVNSMTVAGAHAAAYSVLTPPAVPFTVTPTGSQVVTVRFAPSAGGTYDNASVEIGSNDPDESSVSVALSGSARIPQPDISLDPTALSFPATAIGDMNELSFTIRNTGDADLQVDSLAIVGMDHEAYALASPPAVPFNVPATTGQQTITVQFLPTGALVYANASVAVGSNDPDEPLVEVSLDGQAINLSVAELEPASSIGADCRAVALDSARAYSGQGAVLMVFDASAPANPTPLGRARLHDVIQSVAVSGNTAYAALGRSGIAPVDVSDPADPQALAAIDTPGHAHAVAVSGSTLAVADGVYGLLLFDIGNPAAPVMTGRYETQGPAVGVALAGTTAYVLDAETGVEIVNIGDPANPTKTGAVTVELGTAIAVAGNTLCIGDHVGALFVANVTNPASPSIQSESRLGGIAKALAVSGNTLCAALGAGGLEFIDIANPASPSSQGQHAAAAMGLAPDGNQVWTAAGAEGLHVIDFSNPAAPGDVGTWNFVSAPLSAAIDGAGATVGESQAGLTIVDLSVSQNPGLSGIFNSIHEVYRIEIEGNLAYAACGEDGLRIVDLSNPALPAAVGSFATEGPAIGVSVAGSMALVTDGNKVYALNIGNPANPLLAGEWAAAGRIFGVALSGNRAFVAEGGYGLRILDMSNPASPAELGSLDTPGVASSVALAGDNAYVADGRAGLQIVGVADPANPVPLGSWDTAGIAVDVAAASGKVYLLDTLAGLEILDVSNPVAPSPVGRSRLPVHAHNVAVSGQRYAVADDEGGLIVFGGGSSAARYWRLYGE